MVDPNTGQAPVQDPAGTPAGEPGSGTPDTFELDINGQKQSVSLDDLKGGYLRQQDYTKKTQELSGMRDRYQAYEQFEQVLNSNPELADEIGSLIEQRIGGGTPQAPQQGQADDGSSDIPGLKQQVAFLQDQQAKTSVDHRIESLARKYPNADSMEVVQYALDHNLGVDFEGAYKMLSFDKAVSAARQDGEKAGADAVIKAISDRGVVDFDAGKTGSPQLQRDQLSKEETAYAKMLQLTPAQYLEGKKKKQNA